MKLKRLRKSLPGLKVSPIDKRTARAEARRFEKARLSAMELVNMIPSMFHGASTSYFLDIAARGLRPEDIAKDRHSGEHGLVFTGRALLAKGYAERKQIQHTNDTGCKPTLSSRGRFIVHVKSKTPLRLRRGVVDERRITKYMYVPPKYLEMGMTYTHPGGDPIFAQLEKLIRKSGRKLPRQISAAKMQDFEENVSILSQFYLRRLRPELLRTVGKALDRNRSITIAQFAPKVSKVLAGNVSDRMLREVLAARIAEDLLPTLYVEKKLACRKVGRGPATNLIFYRR